MAGGLEGDEPEGNGNEPCGSRDVGPAIVGAGVAVGGGESVSGYNAEREEGVEGEASGDAAEQPRWGSYEGPEEEEQHEDGEEELAAVDGDGRACGEAGDDGCGGRVAYEDGYEWCEETAECGASFGADDVDDELDGYGELEEDIDEGEIGVEGFVVVGGDVAEDGEEEEGAEGVEGEERGEDRVVAGDVSGEERDEEGQLEEEAEGEERVV